MSTNRSRITRYAALSALSTFLQSFATTAGGRLAATLLLIISTYFVNAQGPVFNSTPVKTATVGQNYTYGATATEPSNKPVTMNVVTKPSWLTFTSGGQSTSTQFGGAIPQPGGVAGDAAGNIYVAELTGNKIHKIAPDGTTTLWFNNRGSYIYAMMVYGNDLYISNFYDNNNYYGSGSITKVNLTGTPVETTVVAAGSLVNPLSMVYRDGFFYIADYGAGAIRKYNLASKALTDVATLDGVFGLGFSQAGLLYAASWNYSKVYTLNPAHANPQSTLTEKISPNNSVSDVKVDANGYVYISGWGFVRKYTPDLSSYTIAWSGDDIIWGMSLTPGGALVFGLENSSQVHKLQTGATLSGTPAIGDIGVHSVSIKADNGVASTFQNYDISVYGPSTYTVSDLTKNQGDEPFELPTPSSNSTGAFSYTSSNPSVATVSGNMVTITGIGTTTITVTQAAAGLYLQTAKTFVLTVKPQLPVISSFTPAYGTAGTSVTINGGFFTGASQVTIGGKPVSSFTVVNSTQIMAVVAAGTPNGVISVTTPAGTGYSAASFSTVLPPAVTSVTPASGRSGDVITIKGSHFTGATAVTINGTPVQSFVVVDANTITAEIAAGNTTGKIAVTTPFGSAATTADFVVLQKPSISGFSAMNKTYGDAPFTLAQPTSNSTGAFTYSSSNTAVATVNGNVVTIVGAGTATITASQAADAKYVAGSTSATLTVAKAMPVVTGFTPITKTYGDAAFTLTAPVSASPGSFTYNSSHPGVATMSGNTVMLVGAGATTITAVQAETANYQSASVTAVLTVGQAQPLISGFADMAKTYGDAAFTLTAPVSNSTGAFTFESSNTAVATVSGNTITIVGAGTATITVLQAADPNYLPGSITATLTVAKAIPVLSSFAAIEKVYGDAPFGIDVPASPSNGSFNYTSSNNGVATISGHTITITGAGTTTITATQAETANYTSGTITTSLYVGKATPVLDGFEALTKTYGDPDFELSAPSSASPGAFTYTSSNAGVATVNGSTITINGAGVTTMTAEQAETANYKAASITAILSVAKAAPTMKHFADIAKTYGDPSFALALPVSNSTGAFTFTSSNPSVATVNGMTITIVGAGTATITATQAADVNYNSGSITAVLSVAKATPVVEDLAAFHKTYGDAPFHLAAPASNSPGAFTFTSANIAVASLSGGRITVRGAGSVTITARQSETDNYTEATVTTTLTVAPKMLTVRAADKIRCTGQENPAFTYTITGFVNGENVSELQTVPSLTTAANRISAAGHYPITANGAVAANYSFTYQDGTLQVADPVHTPQRMSVVDVLQDESTPLLARSFGVGYQWTPAAGLSNATTAAPYVRLQDEQEYRIAITEASGCVVVDTLQVRVFERPDVFVPTLFSPNGDGINDVLRLNAVALRSLNYFRVYNQWGKLVFQTNSLAQGWDGRFQGQLQPMATYTWTLSAINKNGKIINRSGSVTLAR